MSECEAFWSGPFGAAYTERCRPDPKQRRSFWELMLEQTSARSILEVGCNWGPNLTALRDTDPTLKLRGVDVNPAAIAEAQAATLDVRECPAREVGERWPHRFGLVFTAGVLIHVPPVDLIPTMKSIIKASNRHVLAVEYAAEDEEEIDYRGQAGRLWKRPYGEMYEAMGLNMVSSGYLAPGDGFDSCHFWLLSRPEE